MRQDCKNSFCSSVNAEAVGTKNHKEETKHTTTNTEIQKAFLTIGTDNKIAKSYFILLVYFKKILINCYKNP